MKFSIRQRVTKIRGSSWTGHIVGFYSSSLTPCGICVESENEPGAVQLYPEDAFALCMDPCDEEMAEALAELGPLR